MKTNRFFLALAFALMIGGSNVFAQNGPTDNDRPEERPRKRPTPEQMMDNQVERMQNQLMLDDKTADKFASLYKEYLEAMGECRMTNAEERKENIRKGDRTDKDIMNELEGRLDRQQKMLDIKRKYFNSFKKILTPRQLEKVFAPAPRHFGPHAWKQPRRNWKDNRFRPCGPHRHGACIPETCPHHENLK